MVGLTNDDPTTTPPVYKQYHHIQYNRILPPSATATVRFPPSDDLFRYVIIQKSFASAEAICLNEVKVFLRGMYALINLFLADRTARSMISYWHVDVRGVYPYKANDQTSPNFHSPPAPSPFSFPSPFLSPSVPFSSLALSIYPSVFLSLNPARQSG